MTEVDPIVRGQAGEGSMKHVLLVLRAVGRAVCYGVWLLRDSESDVADLYPENQTRGEGAATRGSVFASMSGVGHP